MVRVNQSLAVHPKISAPEGLRLFILCRCYCSAKGFLCLFELGWPPLYTSLQTYPRVGRDNLPTVQAVAGVVLNARLNA